jgi:carboxymethylenebutenolidase
MTTEIVAHAAERRVIEWPAPAATAGAGDEAEVRAMREAMQAGLVTIGGAGGDEIDAYLAHPLDGPSRGGVVVIHHMPGWDEATKEITRRFAAWGYAAICPNLHHRDAPGADPDDAAAASRANGGVPDERMLGDLGAAVEHLRGLEGSTGKVGTIGYCSGGRQSLLAGCRLPVDAAVDCYGAFVLGPPPEKLGLTWLPIREALGELGCPVLGLFGEEDRNPTPEEVTELDELLTALGKDHEFHRYPDAGHAFFAVDRPSYRQAAAVDGWRKVRDFFARHLS